MSLYVRGWPRVDVGDEVRKDNFRDSEGQTTEDSFAEDVNADLQVDALRDTRGPFRDRVVSQMIPKIPL